MISATYGPVEDIELMWALIALIGVIYSSINVREALSDWNFVRERHITNGRRLLARAQLAAESLRLFVLLVFLIIGVLATTIENPAPSHLPTNVVVIQFIIRWGLIASSVALVVKSYLAKRVRDEFKRDNHLIPDTKEKES